MNKGWKAVCSNCGWKGLSGELLIAKHPFIPNEKVSACPTCKDLEDTVTGACDKKGCWEKSTCGTPVKQRYMRLCSYHYQQLGKDKPGPKPGRKA